MSLIMGNLDAKAGTGVSTWSTKKPLIWDCAGIPGGTSSGVASSTSGMSLARSWICRIMARSFLRPFLLHRSGVVSVLFMSVISGIALLCVLALRGETGLRIGRKEDRG